MYKSDAEWYFSVNDDEERYYEIFFQLCHKYKINWASASDKDRYFIEEATRVKYERERAKLDDLTYVTIKPAFV